MHNLEPRPPTTLKSEIWIRDNIMDVSLTSAQHIDTMSSTVSKATRAVGHVKRKRGSKERPHYKKEKYC